MYRTMVHMLWRPLSLLLLCTALFLTYLLLKPVPFPLFIFGDNLLQVTLGVVGLLLSLPILLPAGTHNQGGRRASPQWMDRWLPSGSAAPLLLACALLSYVIGKVIWTLNEDALHLHMLFPSWADACFLASYPFVLLAILLLPCQSLLLVNLIRIVFEAVIALTGVITLSWYFVLGPSIQRAVASVPGRIVGTAYPLWTLLLIFCLFLLVVRNNPPALRSVTFLLFLALIIIAATGTIYGYRELFGAYRTGSLLDPGWPLGYLLLGLVARTLYMQPQLRQRDTGQAERNQQAFENKAWWQTLFPYIWVIPPLLLLLFLWRHGGDLFLVTGVVLGTIILLSLVLALQLINLSINNDALAAANRQLEFQATHDSLTSLPNRRFLQMHIEQATWTARKSQTPAALLLLDLDRFKEVNDTFGHDVGDQLLQQISSRLQGHLRPGDLLARLGGDEFAILLPTTDTTGAIQVADALLGALNDPFSVDEQVFEVRGSIGIALTPAHGDTVTTLLRHADVAMYMAKHSQSSPALYSTEEDQHHPRKLALVSELRQAIAGDGLLLYYQPKVSLAAGRLVGVEALLRWRHPVHGAIGPDEFIPQAEVSGLIDPLTHWVIERAIQQCLAWERAGLQVNIEINLSTRTLYDRRLLSIMDALLQTSGIAPGRLTFEITESTLMAEPERAMAVLTGLRRLGISISIDDFGTGYSSLAYLKRLPIDEVKIDKTFVSGLDGGGDPADIAIVRAVIAIAHPLGCKVVAEGVERAETLAFLRELGCDLAQGYYISRPLSAAALEQWIRTSPWGYKN